MKKKLTVVGAMLIALLFTSLSCQKPKSEDFSEPEAVTTRIKWLPGITYIGSYMAKEKGYWQNLGLDVTVLPGGFEADPIKLVAAGSNHFGITGSEQLLQARSQGVPIVAIYMELDRSPAGWMALRSKKIKTPYDFVGKRVGAQYGTNIEPTLDALLGKLNIDPKGLKRIPVKYDLKPFYTDEVDVMPVYLTGQPILAKLEGYDVSAIDPGDYGINLYGNVYFTTERLIRERPDLVQRFVIGLLKGWQDSIKDPAAAVNLMIHVEPRLVPNQERAFLEATIPFIRNKQDPRLGRMSLERWQETRDIMVRYGGLPASVEAVDAFTNKFIDEAHQQATQL
jgi:NitT/TauT family transport system substrate-binding protein